MLPAGVQTAEVSGAEERDRGRQKAEMLPAGVRTVRVSGAEAGEEG